MACATLKRHLEFEPSSTTSPSSSPSFFPNKRLRCTGTLRSMSMSPSPPPSFPGAANATMMPHQLSSYQKPYLYQPHHHQQQQQQQQSPFTHNINPPSIISKLTQDKLAIRIIDELLKKRLITWNCANGQQQQQQQQPEHQQQPNQQQHGQQILENPCLGFENSVVVNTSDLTFNSERPIFTFCQVNKICRKILQDFEKELCDEYEKILTRKLSEQYDIFVRFSQDQIRKHFQTIQPSFYEMCEKNASNCNGEQIFRCLNEIEASDDFWGPAFRLIISNTDNLNDKVEFHKILGDKLQIYDDKIENLCNRFCNSFLDSVHDLPDLRNQSHRIKNHVTDLNKDLQNVSKDLIEKGTELMDNRQIQNNIAAVCTQLKLSLPVLEKYAFLRKQIAQKKYYPALITLRDLEDNYLPHIIKYRFSMHICDMIPKIRENIEKESLKEFQDFLENIRKFSSKIGNVAMNQTNRQLADDQTIRGRRKKRNINPDLYDSNSEEFDINAADLIDFSPVYRCLDMSNILGFKTKFESYYQTQRLKQVRLVIDPPNNMHESLNNFTLYIHSIVGFFVIEHHILSTADYLITRAFLDDMWSNALSKIISELTMHTSYCTDANLILQVKDLMVLFYMTMRKYEFSIKSLCEFLYEIRDHYNEMLMQRWVQVFREILDNELIFRQIQVTNRVDFDSLLTNYPWDEESIIGEDGVEKPNFFPYVFPFSEIVPKMYRQVKEFIYASLKFTEDLDLSQREVDEVLNKSINLLLTRTLNGCLSSHFRKPNLGLTQIIQLIIDTGYLAKSTKYLEQFVCNITSNGINEKPSHRVRKVRHRTQANLFKIAHDEAIKQICIKIQAKLDEFFELEEYDWLLSEPSGHASSYITDSIAFLRSTFESFNYLPTEIAEIACKAACQHIAKFLSDLIFSEDVKQLTLGAINQLNLDLLQCEQFCATVPVPNIKHESLLEYFASLRQLLDLFITWDWTTYFHDAAHYNLVDVPIAILILEKLKEAERKNLFTILTRNERDNRKLLDIVLKQLKQLQFNAAKESS